jgi:hypothetical protein
LIGGLIATPDWGILSPARGRSTDRRIPSPPGCCPARTVLAAMVVTMKKGRLILEVRPDSVPIRPSRKSKVGLPPRGPNCRRLPRVDIDFGGPDVINCLVKSGMDPLSSARHRLNDWIRPMVEIYCSDRQIARRNPVTQKQLRGAASRLDRAIAAVIRLLSEDSSASASDRALIEALRVELDDMDVEEAPDPQYVRTALDAVQQAARRVRDSESGAGRPIDRAALDLVHGLANIFKECTGRISGSVDGRFAEFVGLIDRRLPEELQFSDKDCDIGALISNAVALSSSDTAKFGPTASPLEAFSCTPSRMHGDDKCRQELRFSFAFQAKNSTP